jgi:phenylpyruvate tautomerase PptA (4-oxalocrotonate tautomerase family)
MLNVPIIVLIRLAVLWISFLSFLECINLKRRTQKMPVVFIEAPPGIRTEAKRTMVEKITSAVDEAYRIGDTLVFLREYAPENVALDGRLQSENPKILEALSKISSGGEVAPRTDNSTLEGKSGQPAQLHEDKFLRILWIEQTRIISIVWREATSEMTDEDFKSELTLFANQVEEKKAPRILVDVSGFRHKPGAEVGQWRLKNISTRYNAAGVERFAFVFPKDSQIQPMANQSSEGEQFQTQAFNSYEQAVAWLTA